MIAFYRDTRRLLTLACLLLMLPWTAQAAWWEFGRSAGEPYFSMLRFNNVDAEQRDDMLVLTRDDLIAGNVVIRGRAEVGRGEVGLVEISLDGGKTRANATLGERGMFVYEFAPQLDRQYTFQIRAISTTGVSTGAEEHDFKLLVTSADGAREARAAFMKLLEAYQREDRITFMRGVSEQFEGNISALEDGLAKDFRFLDDIHIQVNVNQINRQERTYEISFSYNRQVRSAKSGNLLKDTATSIVGFRLESGGMKLVRMAAPLIFGISEAEDVATSVTGQSVGQSVITIDSTGNASTGTQGQTTASSGAEGGTRTLASRGFVGGMSDFDGFDFATDDKTREENMGFLNGDIAWSGYSGGFLLKSGVSYKTISGPASAVRTVPTTGYSVASAGMPISPATPGSTFALKLLSGKYAVIEIVSTTITVPHIGSFTFRYKYQPNGSPNF